jgi:hypothetical protein
MYLLTEFGKNNNNIEKNDKEKGKLLVNTLSVSFVTTGIAL